MSVMERCMYRVQTRGYPLGTVYSRVNYSNVPRAYQLEALRFCEAAAHNKNNNYTRQKIILILRYCFPFILFKTVFFHSFKKKKNMSQIPGSAHINLSLGGLVMAGGLVGYLKKGSHISLVSGITVGSLLLGSGYLIAKTEHVYEGHVLATTTSSVLALAMGHRFVTTSKFMPAGFMAVLGAAACAYNFHKSREWAPAKEE